VFCLLVCMGLFCIHVSSGLYRSLLVYTGLFLYGFIDVFCLLVFMGLFWCTQGSSGLYGSVFVYRGLFYRSILTCFVCLSGLL